jgi:hypothetical protein
MIAKAKLEMRLHASGFPLIILSEKKEYTEVMVKTKNGN